MLTYTLAPFYAWSADHQHIPEIKTLATTIGTWQQPVTSAVLTGYSNATAGAHNARRDNNRPHRTRIR